MVTTISIDEPLYQHGERAARHLGISRSELYARALATFLSEQVDLASASDHRTDHALAALEACAPNEPCW